MNAYAVIQTFMECSGESKKVYSTGGMGEGPPSLAESLLILRPPGNVPLIQKILKYYTS